MNVRERLRRWWRPAEYEEDHPLSEKEREELEQRMSAENINLSIDEAPGTATGPGTMIDVDDEFRRG
jgi:hypothetical protein